MGHFLAGASDGEKHSPIEQVCHVHLPAEGYTLFLKIDVFNSTLTGWILPAAKAADNNILPGAASRPRSGGTIPLKHKEKGEG